jgi:hypothetical protein
VIEIRNPQARVEHLSQWLIDGVWIDLGSGGPQSQVFDELYRVSTAHTIFCVDLWPELLERHPMDRVNLMVADMRQCRFNGIDLVTMIHSIEHLTEDEAHTILAQMQQTVKRIVVETPDQFEDGSGAIEHSRNPYNKHLSHITSEFMEEFGFTRTATSHVGPNITNGIYVWGAE